VLAVLASERRSEEDESESDREPDPPHGHLRWGMAGGSLADEYCTQELAALVGHAYPT